MRAFCFLAAQGRFRTAEAKVERLELAFDASAQSWLGHQAAFDLWHVEPRRKALTREVRLVETIAA